MRIFIAMYIILVSIITLGCGKKQPPLPSQLANISCPQEDSSYAFMVYSGAQITHLCLEKTFAEKLEKLNCNQSDCSDYKFLRLTQAKDNKIYLCTRQFF